MKESEAITKGNPHLGMLIFSFLMVLISLLVMLKMESLLGLMDLVVSMTKVMGGLSTFWFGSPDSGHSWHWQLPRHLCWGGHKLSGDGEDGSQSQEGERGGRHRQSWKQGK